MTFPLNFASQDQGIDMRTGLCIQCGGYVLGELFPGTVCVGPCICNRKIERTIITGPIFSGTVLNKED